MDEIQDDPGTWVLYSLGKGKGIAPERWVGTAYPLVEKILLDVIASLGTSCRQCQSPYISCWLNYSIGAIVLFNVPCWGCSMPLSSSLLFCCKCKLKVGILLANMAEIWKDNCFLGFVIAESETENERNALLVLLNLSAFCVGLLSKRAFSLGLSELLIESRF